MKLFSSIHNDYAQFIQILEELERIGIVPESILYDRHIISQNQQYSNVQLDDLMVISLTELPFELPDFFVAAALLKRNAPNYRLVIDPAKIEMGKDFMLPNQARVLCQDTISSLQMKCLMPDFQITLLDDISTISDYDAALLRSEISFFQDDSWISYDIQISEIIPNPGEGVAVILCHKDNINLRKKLNSIHCDRTARSTNIERSVLKTYSTQLRKYIGVHCAQDSENNFQVNAISLVPDKRVKKVQYSTVTSFELDKIVIEMLNSEW